MKSFVLKGVMFITITWMWACEYNVAEELYPPTECISDSMSYVTNIEPIISHNCYACHSLINAPANGTMVLEGYDELIKYVNNGQLLGAIKWESGFSRMPQDAPQLPDCDIIKIESWINDGAPDN